MTQTYEPPIPEHHSILKYSCKLCGSQGQTHYDPRFISKRDYWISLLDCNPCADLLNLTAMFRERIKTMVIYRNQLHQTQQLTPEREDAIKKKLSAFAKGIAIATCNRFHTPFLYDDDFPQQFLDFPEKITFIVNHYVRMVKNTAFQHHPPSSSNPTP